MTTKTISYTDARANLSKTIDEVVDDIRPVVITKRNKRVVLISEDEYNALMETFHVLRGGNAEYLREAIAQEKSGRVREISMEELKGMLP